MNRNDVSSFFYYMWNAWCKDECAVAFAGSPCGWSHFWNKWSDICHKRGTSQGAAEEFFAELSEQHQDMLVKRATELYNRKRRIL